MYHIRNGYRSEKDQQGLYYHRPDILVGTQEEKDKWIYSPLDGEKGSEEK